VQDIFDECQVNRGSFKGPIPNPHSGLPRYWLFTTRRVIVYLLVVLQSGTSVSCRYSVMTSKDDEAAEREEVSKVVKLQNTLLLILQQRLKSALWYSIGQFVDDALLSDDLNVIKSIIGGCPLSDSYDFTIPADLPATKKCLLAWTWYETFSINPSKVDYALIRNLQVQQNWQSRNVHELRRS
jgi:hypothetical protein